MKATFMTLISARSARFGAAVVFILGLGLAGCSGADSADLQNTSGGVVASDSAGDASGIKAVVVAPSYHKIVGLGQTVQLTADVWFNDGTLSPDATDSVTPPSTGADPLPLHWKTDNYGIAAVDDAGLVTGVSSGETLIHAVVDGHEALARIVVENVTSLDPNIDPGLPPP